MAGNKDKMVKCYNWTGERYVAEAKRLCSRFEENTSRETPEITHYDHY